MRKQTCLNKSDNAMCIVKLWAHFFALPVFLKRVYFSSRTDPYLADLNESTKQKWSKIIFYLFYKSSGIDSNFKIFEDPLQLIFWLFNSIASKYVVLSFPSSIFYIKSDVYSLIFSVTFQKKWRPKLEGLFLIWWARLS